jgi:peptide-methionine (R)-S-oxide reductase
MKSGADRVETPGAGAPVARKPGGNSWRTRSATIRIGGYETGIGPASRPMFESLQAQRTSRRAMLVMPFAFAGLAAVGLRRDRPLPDAATGGTGGEVDLALFSNTGERQSMVRVRKIVMSPAEWRRQLAVEEFAVTRQAGTEPPYSGRYWNTHGAGLYRCVCCGNALFRSQEKFDSGTGWPSFTAPIAEENIRTAVDMSFSMERVEVLCRKCDAHLGHVFDDGPPPSGNRYCMNSAALRFIRA